MSRDTKRLVEGLLIGVGAAMLTLVPTNIVAADAFDHNHASYTAILGAHVVNGGVNYKALKASPQALDRYIGSLTAVREHTFKTWSEAQQIAFLSNLYNAATLKLIVDHYPIKSIKEIGSLFKGPWDQPVVTLFGKTITLNRLEHGILRKDYDEPRLHMALVCAAKSCPPLRSEAYTADRLNEQFDDQSKTYLTSPSGLQLDRPRGEIRLSAIFKWYGGDFPSVTGFVSQYSGHKVTGLKIRYIDYDWSLNE
jgi:hypothetical protein